MFVRIYLKSTCVAGERDPIPLSDSDHTLKPDPLYGSGLINMNCIREVFPFDGDFSSERCLIYPVGADVNFCYVSDDFQKIKEHFYLEF